RDAKVAVKGGREQHISDGFTGIVSNSEREEITTGAVFLAGNIIGLDRASPWLRHSFRAWDFHIAQLGLVTRRNVAIQIYENAAMSIAASDRSAFDTVNIVDST